MVVTIDRLIHIVEFHTTEISPLHSSPALLAADESDEDSDMYLDCYQLETAGEVGTCTGALVQ